MKKRRAIKVERTGEVKTGSDANGLAWSAEEWRTVCDVHGEIGKRLSWRNCDLLRATHEMNEHCQDLTWERRNSGLWYLLNDLGTMVGYVVRVSETDEWFAYARDFFTRDFKWVTKRYDDGDGIKEFLRSEMAAGNA